MSRRRRSKNSISSRRGGGTITKTKTKKKNNRQTEINRKTHEKEANFSSVAFVTSVFRFELWILHIIVLFRFRCLAFSYRSQPRSISVALAVPLVTSHRTSHLTFHFHFQLISWLKSKGPAGDPSQKESPSQKEKPLWERETRLREREAGRETPSQD